MEQQQQQQQQQQEEEEEDGGDSSGASSFYSFVRHDLPKVELHAHLNGCIPVALLQELARERGVTLNSKYFRTAPAPNDDQSSSPSSSSSSAPILKPPDMYNLHPRSLQDCFDMFAELPAIVNDLTAVRRITEAALQEFANHHVAYLELRSTPKVLKKDFGAAAAHDELLLCTKQEYCETILDVMRDFERREKARYDHEMQSRTTSSFPRLPLVCRFLVSIDRSQSLQQAQENVDLAIRMHHQQRDDKLMVVGVDLGGNPTKQDFRIFQPLFEKARDHGLKVTIHLAEIPCDAGTVAYAEAAAILNFGPDRVGHAVLLPPELLNKLDALQIPIETCPTSNIMTLELHHHHHDDDKHGDLAHGLQQHSRLKYWLTSNHSSITHSHLHQHHPITVGTDDPGVFDTTATQELWLLATAFELDMLQLARIVTDSVTYVFCDDETKALVRERVRTRVDDLQQQCDETPN